MDAYSTIDVSAPAGTIRPTRLSSLLFAAKAAIFRARRALADFGAPVRRLARGDAATFPVCVAVSRTALWPDAAAGETVLQRGKVQNLRVAARRFDRARLDPGKIFSFWAELGRPSHRRGFAPGRTLQEGCLVPSVGGGLCQLSNALYDAALQAGCEIVERHAHSRVIPGSAAAAGRDATVAWNYVDLRFRSDRPLLLRVTLERDQLVVGLFAETQEAVAPRDAPAEAIAAAARSCASCGQSDCHRHERPRPAPAGRTAFCVDALWPEFDAYLAGERKQGDVLCLPLDGRRWHRPNYAWTTAGFAQIHTAFATTVLRAVASRRLADQGAARQTALLLAAEALARAYAGALAPDVTTLCVTQTLLPHLWRDGHLGGRRFSVLMTRLPMAVLHARLDAAARLHPGAPTLSDFRAPAELVAAESAALTAADRIVTPHAGIAALFGARAVRLAWRLPAASHTPRRPAAADAIAFPGPTVARKGALALREAARQLDLEVLLSASVLEGDGFWDGIRTRRVTGDEALAQAAAVVQPAFVEDRPRHLLAAIAAGIPVVATPACGLDAGRGVTLVPEGDADALAAALKAIL